MIVKMRDCNGKLAAKDILDITFDMSVEKKEGKYVLKINNNYYSTETFDTETAAENALLHLADCRNQLENELRELD